MLTSYAQNFEDVMLWRALGAVEHGFYIDIGAQHPVVDSVSLAFYERGWRGVHVEPVPANAQALREARPDEEVIEAAISQSIEPITIFAIPETGLSTGQPVIAEQHRSQGFPSTPVEVPTMRLSDLLDKHAGRHIHWLKIDVEGMEQDVIESWSPSDVRPWILCVEATRPRSPEPNFESWELLLLERGYNFVYFDGLNRFYVHESHQDLTAAFQTPPNVFDAFTLGGQASAPFSHRLNAVLQDVQARLQHSEAEVIRLHHHIAATDITNAEQRGALTERATALEQQSQALEQELESLRQKKIELETAQAAEEASHAGAMAAVERQLTRLTAELQHAQAEHSVREEALRHQISATEVRCAEQRGAQLEKIATLDQQINALQKELEMVRGKNINLTESLSIEFATIKNNIDIYQTHMHHLDDRLKDFNKDIESKKALLENNSNAIDDLKLKVDRIQKSWFNRLAGVLSFNRHR